MSDEQMEKVVAGADDQTLISTTNRDLFCIFPTGFGYNAYQNLQTGRYLGQISSLTTSPIGPAPDAGQGPIAGATSGGLTATDNTNCL